MLEARPVNALLPRREYTKRHNYNVMRHTNYHAIMASGYICAEQGQTDSLGAIDQLSISGKGINAYRRID